MVTKVRQASRFGACDMLGEVINETSHAYIFRRPDGETGFISKRAPTLHVGPCRMCVRTIITIRHSTRRLRTPDRTTSSRANRSSLC